MSLTAVFHFSVNRLWISADMRGTVHQLMAKEGTICSIQFPNTSDDFGLNESPNHEMAIKGYVGSAGSDPFESPVAVQVHVVRVSVEGPGELSQADFNLEDPEAFRSASNTAFAIMNDFHNRAASALGSFLTWIRATCDQFWLGLAGEPPRLAWNSELRDEAGNRLPIGFPGLTTIAMMGVDKISLTSEIVTKIASEIASGKEPILEKVFLADAEYIARESEWHNLRQALLMAAISCEIAVKRTLRNAASAEQQSLVELVLANPRDVSLAAASLFDKGCEAVFGKSLRKERLDLYKRVDRLFQDRNKVAHHGGAGLSDDVLAAHVSTAREALQWLSSLASTA